MKVTGSSETSVLTYQITPSHIPEDRNFITPFVLYMVTTKLYVNRKMVLSITVRFPSSEIPACFVFDATHCKCFGADACMYIYIWGTVAQLVGALR